MTAENQLKWRGQVAWRNWGNMTPSPPAPEPYTQGDGWYTDEELTPPEQPDE